MDFTKIKIVLVGYGSIGQAITPLLLNSLSIKPAQILIITADDRGRDIADTYGIEFHREPLMAENYQHLLVKYLSGGDLLLNLSVDVSSLALLQWCQAHDVFYLDTCVEPWRGGYNNAADVVSTTNFFLRHQLLASAKHGESNNTTAIIAHGANPGLISHLLKAGLQNLAALKNITHWLSWADLARQLGIKVVQIAECDTQDVEADLPQDCFANTWSAHGFAAEAGQMAEAGWGSHEDSCDEVTAFSVGETSGVYFGRRGANVSVKSWVPFRGEMTGMLISHHEAFSIAELLSIRDSENHLTYRPTVYFAYQPAPLACKSLQQYRLNNFILPRRQWLLRDTVVTGFDQLGVLLVFEGGCYWYGSTLSIAQARALAPYNNATSLQVAAGILGALRWMQKNPKRGVVEAEDMDHEDILQTALPFLGDVSGHLSDWQPGARGALQMRDFLVMDFTEEK